jgi:hypothetical protein
MPTRITVLMLLFCSIEILVQKSCEDAKSGKVVVRENQAVLMTTATAPRKEACQFSIPKVTTRKLEYVKKSINSHNTHMKYEFI